jgi:hypothetical protein
LEDEDEKHEESRDWQADEVKVSANSILVTRPVEIAIELVEGHIRLPMDRELCNSLAVVMSYNSREAGAPTILGV